MEPAILIICGIVAIWAITKTGGAVRFLREQRRDSDDSGRNDGYGSGVGGIDPGGSSGHGHGGGDCGGHGGGGHGG
jgi:hypothetical protein